MALFKFFNHYSGLLQIVPKNLAILCVFENMSVLFCIYWIECNSQAAGIVPQQRENIVREASVAPPYDSIAMNSD